MSLPILKEIGIAFRNLNPNDVRGLAEREFTLGVLSVDEAVWAEIVSFLIPEGTSPAKTREAGRHILRMTSESDFARCEVGLSEPGLPHPSHFYSFDGGNASASFDVLLEDNEDLWLPMGRRFPGVRDLVMEKIIWKISKENALFTVATAVPNIVPSLISLPWAAGEFASDTAFLTMNQVRMAFLIAAASDREVGYQSQKAQIGSIVAAAFGWRALARELVSKIPAGGGLIGKGTISLAGTYAVGKSLERLFRFGRGLTRAERRQHYDDAFARSRDVVQQIVQRVTRRPAAAHSA
ncbi:MAG: hypothetical protein WD733_18635 [Bryobacterales bacterium]